MRNIPRTLGDRVSPLPKRAFSARLLATDVDSGARQVTDSRNMGSPVVRTTKRKADSPSASGRNLQRRIERRLKELPVLPAALTELMRLDKDSNSYFDDIVSVVEREPTFAIRALRAANSAANAPASPITRIRDAVSRVGCSNTTALLLSATVTRVFVPRTDWERGLWRHSLHVAVASRTLARMFSGGAIDPEVAYLCGLLHDLGRFVMFLEAPEVLQKIDEAEWDEPDALIEAERQVCGLLHTELGERICELWSLPPVVASVVRHHHDPPGDAADRSNQQKLDELMRLCDLAMFPSVSPDVAELPSMSDAALLEALQARLPSWLHAPPARLQTALTSIAKEAAQIANVVGVG